MPSSTRSSATRCSAAWCCASRRRRTCRCRWSRASPRAARAETLQPILFKSSDVEDWGTMFESNKSAHRRVLPLALSLCALACAAPAFGQTASEPAAKKSEPKRPTVSQAKPASPNATVNLVNLLVKQGVLAEDQAQARIRQAEDEAYVARQAAKDANMRADEAARTATAASAAASPPGTRHVTYVPEVVKRQLREDIKREVMAK